MDMLTKKAVPMDLLFKGPEEQKVSKEEENTFILQVSLVNITCLFMKFKSYGSFSDIIVVHLSFSLVGHFERNSCGFECIGTRGESSTGISNCGALGDFNHQCHHVRLLFHWVYN